MNQEAVYRTASATPSLLNTSCNSETAFWRCTEKKLNKMILCYFFPLLKFSKSLCHIKYLSLYSFKTYFKLRCNMSSLPSYLLFHPSETQILVPILFVCLLHQFAEVPTLAAFGHLASWPLHHCFPSGRNPMKESTANISWNKISLVSSLIFTRPGVVKTVFYKLCHIK